MTNEQKAIELAEKRTSEYSHSLFPSEIIKALLVLSAVDAAEWKSNIYKEKIQSIIQKIQENMKKCNVGTVFGTLYQSGYEQGVKDVLEMFKNNVENEDI